MSKIKNISKILAGALLSAALWAPVAMAQGAMPGSITSQTLSAGPTVYLMSGNIWQNNDYDMETNITRDASGNVYVGGTFSPDSSTTTQRYRPFIRKVDSSGAEVWTSTVSNPGNPSSGYDYGRGAAIGTDTSVYLLSIRDMSSYQEIVVTKYNSTSGLKVWESTYTANDWSANAYGIVADANYVYVAGTLYNDIAIFRFAVSDGTPQAPTPYDGGMYWNTAYAIAQNVDYIALTGIIYEEGDYNTGDPDYGNEIWTAKFKKSDMSLVWASTYTSANHPEYGYDEGHAVKMDLAGNVYAAGFYYNENSGSDIWLGKYDGNGDLMFARTKNGPSNGYDKGLGLTLDSFGNIYVAGKMEAWSENEGNNAWIGKYGPGGMLQSEIPVHISDEVGYDVVATNDLVVMGGGFGQDFGLVYIQPGHFGTPPDLVAGPGQYTGSVELGWMPGTTDNHYYAIRYATYPVTSEIRPNSNTAWSSTGTVTTTSNFDPAKVTIQGLPVRESYVNGTNEMVPEYYFKVWHSTDPLWGFERVLNTIASAVPAAPYSYWYPQYSGQDNFWVFQSANAESSAMLRVGTDMYVAYGGQLGDKNGMALMKFTAMGGAEWTSYYNYADGNASINVRRMVQDAGGNIYVFGDAEIDGSGNLEDAWIAKFTSNGLLVWDDVVSTTGDDSFGDVDFDTAGKVYAGGEADGAMLMVKYEPASQAPSQQWISSFTLTANSSPAAIWGLDVDGSDNIYAGGYFSITGSAVEDQDSAIVKFDTSLVVQSSASYSNPAPDIFTPSGDQISDLVVSGAEIYAAGVKDDHDGGNNSNFWAGNINAGTLAEVWSSTYNSVDGETSFTDAKAYSLTMDQNYLYAAGYEERADGQNNMVLRKYDVETASGDVLWTKVVDGHYEGDSAAALSVNIAADSGYTLVSGLFSMDNGQGNPGVARLSEPITGIAVQMGPKPCSVDLAWVSDTDLPEGTTFYVHYATYTLADFSTPASTYTFNIDYYAGPGSYISHIVPGLEAGNGAPSMYGDNIDSPRYYFRIGYKRDSDNVIQVVDASTDAVANTPGTWDRTDNFPNGRLFVINQVHGGSNPLVRDSEGYIYTAGKFDAWGWNSNTTYVRKFTRTGEPVWTRYYSDEYEGSAPVINGLALDTSGYLYAVGSAGSNANLSYWPYTAESATKKDMLVIKYAASDGRMQWAKTYDSAGTNDELYGVAAGPSALYVAGRAVNDGANVGIIGKLDYDDGSLLVSASWNGAVFHSAAYDPFNDRVLVAGSYASGGEMPSPPAGARPISAIGVSTNAVMEAYSASGLLAQEIGISVDGGNDDAFYAVKVDTLEEAIYLAGAVGDSGVRDAFLARYSTATIPVQAWNRAYNSANQNEDAAYGITLDGRAEGQGLYLSGTESRYDLNQGKNLFIRKCNTGGELLWTQNLNSGGNNDDMAGGIAADTLGSVYAAVDAVSMAGAYNNTYDTINGAGFFKHTQFNMNVVNPHLTVKVSSGTAAAAAPQAGVSVAVMGFSSTGGIDPNSINMSLTGSDGKADFTLPAGKSYFVAVSSHNMVPTISDQISDPGGNFFVTLDESTTKEYYISPRSTTTAGMVYKMTINLTTHTATDGTVYLAQNDYVMGEVFINQTGERVAYSVIKASDVHNSMEIYNLPEADNGVYGMVISVPARSKVLQLFMDGSFPAVDTYTASLSAASQLAGSFEVGASTTPPVVAGLVTDANWSPLEGARVSLERHGCSTGWNWTGNYYECSGMWSTVMSKDILTDAGGSYAFYDIPYLECTGTDDPNQPCKPDEAYQLNVRKGGYESGYGHVSGQELQALAAAAVPTPYMQDFQLALATYTLSGVLKYNGVPLPNATVMVFPDWESYNYDNSNAADSYRQSDFGGGAGIRTDARVRTAADGSFSFTGLTDGNARLEAAFEGGWRSLNEGNDFESQSDDLRVVISSLGATSTSLPPNNGCRAGRVWVLDSSGTCKSFGSVAFNIVPQDANTAGLMYGNVTFITTYTVSAAAPLAVSTSAPLTIMAQQECRGDCSNQQMGFTSLSGTFTSNTTSYSIVLSTGYSYYPRIFSTVWARSSSFDMNVNLEEGTTSYRLDLSVLKGGGLSGVVKLPDGSNFKPNWGPEDSSSSYWAHLEIRGVNVDFGDGAQIDEYGEFEFPNLAPGTYKLVLRGQGDGFVWAVEEAPVIAISEGKTADVTLQLAKGLAVRPQIFGLPDVSTAAWSYNIIGVPSGTEMNQKKITEMFFDDPEFSFEYSTSTGWKTMYMPEGQYDFYLVLGAQYDPCDSDGDCGDHDVASYYQFGNFIGRTKGVSVKRSDSNPNLGTVDQPIPINVLGSVGQARMEGTIEGASIFTDDDLDRIFANFDEIFGYIPALMLYDSAGDLRGFTMGMPTKASFMTFWDAMKNMDKDAMRTFLSATPLTYGIWKVPPGRYTAVFSNPNYPPVAKEITLPDNADYDFDFDDEDVVVGAISGVVKSSTTAEGLSGSRVYLKHRTVEKFAVTDSSGNFSFTNLPVGIYRMEVSRNGYVTAGVKTSLAGNDSASFTMHLIPSAAKITGRVFLSKFPTQVTKAGVELVAYNETQNVENPEDYLPKSEVQTDASGNFEIPGVVQGHLYKVSVFYAGKMPEVMEVLTSTESLNNVVSELTLKDIPPQITIKVKKSPDSVNKVDVIIKSPKQLISAPVCSYNPGASYDETSAVSLALVPGPNKTYLGQFTVSSSQEEYTVKVTAGDGGKKMEKMFVYDQNSKAKTEQYIQQESLAGGAVQMDKESEEYSGIELDPGALSYSTVTETTDYSNLVGGFFSALPSVRTVKTEKGNLTITQAVQDMMASEVYNMDLSNASANKPFTLTLKYDKERGAGHANEMRIYQQDDAGNWVEVPGNYTVDPMTGVLSVDVASLTSATEGTGGVTTPLGRKKFGMSSVVNGRYVPSATSTSQSGRFAVFTAKPPTGTAAYSSAFDVVNMPNPFNLKSKNVDLSADIGASGISDPYPTNGTVIKYNLPADKSGNVKFVIYNLAGEKVRTISEGARTGGQIFYSEWDGRNDNNQKCASGVYFMLTYVDGKKLGNKAHKLAIIK